MSQLIKRLAKVDEYIRFEAKDGKEYVGKVVAVYTNSVAVAISEGMYIDSQIGVIDKTVVNHKRYDIITN